MEYLYVVAVMIVVIGILWLYGKGYLNTIDLDATKRILKMSEIIFKKYASTNLSEKYTVIHEVAKEVVEYVEVLATMTPNEDKKRLAYTTTIDIIDQLGTPLTNEDKAAVDMAIEFAVGLLPPTGKSTVDDEDSAIHSG